MKVYSVICTKEIKFIIDGGSTLKAGEVKLPHLPFPCPSPSPPLFSSSSPLLSPPFLSPPGEVLTSR